MSDEKPITAALDLRPEVKAVIYGMNSPRSNIAAVHFDGPVLADMLAGWLAGASKSIPIAVRRRSGITFRPYCFHANLVYKVRRCGWL